MKTTKTNQIRALLAQGKTPGQIAALIGCRRNLVHQVKWQDKQNKLAIKTVKITKKDEVLSAKQLEELTKRIASLELALHAMKHQTFGQKLRNLFN